MRKEDSDTILALVKKNMRLSIGRISQKELNANHFVTDLFSTFEVANKGNPSASITTNRARIQELVSNNTVPYSGRSRYPNFCVDEFIHDFDRQFTLKKPTHKKKPMKKVLHKGIASMMLIALMLMSGCGDDQPNPEDVKQQLRDEIMMMSRQNNDIRINLPMQQHASDTLLMFLHDTKDQYTRNILLQDLEELNGAIEKNKTTFGDNVFKIDQNKRKLARLNQEPEQVQLEPDSTMQYIVGGDTIDKKLVPMAPSDTLERLRQ